MLCNYLKDYKNEFKDSFLFSFVVVSIIVFVIYAVFIAVYTEVVKIPMPAFRICLFKSFLFSIPIYIYGEYRYYKSLRKSDYALFKFKDFKNWYFFKPKKFVFDETGKGVYYIHSEYPCLIENEYRDKYKFEALKIDKTYMFPANFIDFLRFTLFVDSKYKEVKKNKNNVEEMQAKVKGNESLMRVMNDMQADIEKVLKESQGIINKETKKLEEVNS